jgi:ubiquinone/menaquinone biosynthesis C-methylase UbiE
MNEKTKIQSQKLSKSLARKFDKYMMKHKSLYDSLVLLIYKRIEKEDPVILDVGSGSGIMLKRLNHFMPNATVIGIDSSKEMNSMAYEMVYEPHVSHIHLILGFANHVPLKTGCVDAVVSRFSFSYWCKPDQSIAEISRVLKPGGYFILEVLNKDFSRLKLFFIKMDMFFHNARTEVIRYHADAYKIAYDPEEIVSLLSDQSFSIKQVIGKKKDWKTIFIIQKNK